MPSRLLDRFRYTPLGEKSDPSCQDYDQTHLSVNHRNRGVPWSAFLAVFSAQFLLWLLTIFYFTRGQSLGGRLNVDWWKHRSLEGYYPAAEAIRYQELVFYQNATFQTRYGLPTNETDAAWDSLTGPVEGTIQASYDTGFDISRLHATNVSNVDPRWNLYGLEVFHQIHCLNRIRKSFYPEHYFPDESERQISHHREHCIEHLRQSLMCSGDVALDYWWYDEDDDKNWLGTDVPHICRDFSSLNDWVEANKWRYSSWLRSKESQHTEEY